jgi:hypothetical protein
METVDFEIPETVSTLDGAMVKFPFVQTIWTPAPEALTDISARAPTRVV